MRQIFSCVLWVGHANDGRNHRLQLALGIRALVQLAAEEAALQPPRELIYCRFPLLDGPGNDSRQLELAIATLASLVERRVPTLVCCGGGMSRAPAIAAAALAHVYREPADTWLKRLLEHHPADVVPGLWEEVAAMSAHQPVAHAVPSYWTD